MSNLSNTTRDIDIQHPEFWTLQLNLRSDAMQYSLHDVDEENSLIVGTIALDLSAGSYLKALENAVYDNPVLLDVYNKVRVMVESEHFAILPPQFGDEGDAREVLEASFPDAQGDLGVCSLPRCKVAIAFEMPEGVLGFLQRTFNMPAVFHHLYPLCEHYKGHDDNRGVACMHLNLHHDFIDILIVKNHALAMANSFHCDNANDTIYYTLHAWNTFGLEASKDELLLTGSKELRDRITPALREYISYVMPAIFPASALKIGQDAVKAPLELILLALCE